MLNPANQLDLRLTQEKSLSLYQKGREKVNPDEKMSSDIINQESSNKNNESDTKVST